MGDDWKNCFFLKRYQKDTECFFMNLFFSNLYGLINTTCSRHLVADSLAFTMTQCANVGY